MKIKGPNSKEYRAHLKKRLASRRRQARLGKLMKNIYAAGKAIYAAGKAEAELCEAEAAGKFVERRQQVRRQEDLGDSPHFHLGG